MRWPALGGQTTDGREEGPPQARLQLPQVVLSAHRVEAGAPRVVHRPGAIELEPEVGGDERPFRRSLENAKCVGGR